MANEIPTASHDLANTAAIGQPRGETAEIAPSVSPEFNPPFDTEPFFHAKAVSKMAERARSGQARPEELQNMAAELWAAAVKEEDKANPGKFIVTKWRGQLAPGYRAGSREKIDEDDALDVMDAARLAHETVTIPAHEAAVAEHQRRLAERRAIADAERVAVSAEQTPVTASQGDGEYDDLVDDYDSQKRGHDSDTTSEHEPVSVPDVENDPIAAREDINTRLFENVSPLTHSMRELIARFGRDGLLRRVYEMHTSHPAKSAYEQEAEKIFMQLDPAFRKEYLTQYLPMRREREAARSAALDPQHGIFPNGNPYRMGVEEATKAYNNTETFARIYDAGQVAQGRWYEVLHELVEALPQAVRDNYYDYADDRDLALADARLAPATATEAYKSIVQALRSGGHDVDPATMSSAELVKQYGRDQLLEFFSGMHKAYAKDSALYKEAGRFFATMPPDFQAEFTARYLTPRESGLPGIPRVEPQSRAPHLRQGISRAADRQAPGSVSGSNRRGSQALKKTTKFFRALGLVR